MSVPTKFNYRRLNANATTVLADDGGGVVHSVCINVAGASSNTLTLYDNASAASGTVIANFDTTAKGSYILDAGFNSGLTVIIATGTAADVTITYAG